MRPVSEVAVIVRVRVLVDKVPTRPDPQGVQVRVRIEMTEGLESAARIQNRHLDVGAGTDRPGIRHVDAEAVLRRSPQAPLAIERRIVRDRGHVR